MTTALPSLAIYAVIVVGILVSNHRGRRAATPTPTPEPVDNDALWLDVWPEEIDEKAAMRREFEFMIVSEYGEFA
jgi:hypothetical protein